MTDRALGALVVWTSLIAPVLASAFVLERIEVPTSGPPRVRLHCSGPAAVQSQELPARGGQPDRILLDLPGATLGPGARQVVTGPAPLLRVRPEQLNDTTVRITLELDDPVTFTVTGDRVVTVSFGPLDDDVVVPPSVPTVRQPRVGGP